MSRQVALAAVLVEAPAQIVTTFAAPSPRASRTTATVADLALVVLGGSALLIAIVLWFDNAQGGLTGNGVFKSLELKPWVVDPANAPLYPSNYLFYPLYGALCRLLDLLGVFPGDPRRQMTILNAVSCALSLGVMNGDLFSHIIAYSPGFMISGARVGRPPIFISHGRHDPILPFEQCGQRLATDLAHDGYSVEFVAFDDGHAVPSDIATRATRWFAS